MARQQLNDQNMSRREMRRHDRAARRETRFAALGRPYIVVVGLGLIILGVFFLLENAGIVEYSPVWGIILLIPAVGSLVTAWTTYQNEGAFTGTVRSEILGGLVILFIAVMVLFSLDWGALWPVFIIIAGLGSLLAVRQE
jgi:O-antigen/teichoic acid export membrane protein